MPWIKVLKKGAIPGLDGDKAYDFIEVDDYGNPVNRRSNFGRPNKGLTEPKIAPGIRAADRTKGYTKDFDYRQWNSLKAKRKKR